jgi:glycolate oxidase iron-sulfur subunit
MVRALARSTIDLGVDDDDLAACVACGLCLPHCPTYRVTGEEPASPRGRIAAMRRVHWDGAPADDAFVGVMDACVQCRGCETACPSAVPFGRLMEHTRAALAEHVPSYQPWWWRLAYRVLGHHRLLLAGSTAAAVAQRAGLPLPRRAGLPARLPVRRPRLRPSGDDVWLFTGCVMDAWLRDTHAAVQRVVGAAGAGVALPGPGAACCGALHVHAGLREDARRLAERTIAALPGDAPVLVDSAGCGAALKGYGELLGTAEAERFSARVLDVSEWLAGRLDRLPPARRRLAARVAVQDPCHLRHVQRAHEPVRAVLRPYADLVELDDEGLCCGAGGAYATTHPETAGAIRDRKLAAVARSGAGVVASANPGCALHLAAAGLTVRHPLELVDEALGLADGR